MHFPLVILLFSVLPSVHGFDSAFGQRTSFKALDNLMRRQTCKPVPAPATCEKSCGPGNIECIALPHCYNPSAGETCCADGNYCPKGYYCTDAGCCPNGSSLADCNAKVTLSTIAPPKTQASTQTSTAATIAPVSYANTTFTTGKNSAHGTGATVTTAGGGGGGGGGAAPTSIAFSTTTIPLAGGGATTSTAYFVPSSTTTAAVVVQAGKGHWLRPSIGSGAVAWCVLIIIAGTWA